MKQAVNIFLQITSYKTGYPVHIARSCGVTRKELNVVLAASLLGNLVAIDSTSLANSYKESVENTLEEITAIDKPENIVDYKHQLIRWLGDFPNVAIVNMPPHTVQDPNEQAFPLPKAILVDPLILRSWILEWTAFDTDVTEEEAWTVFKPLDVDIGDTHEHFAKLVQECHGDPDKAEFDLSIDGEAGWDVIEMDILKNDTTTEEQEKIWRLREKRTNLDDKAWMEQRRGEIGDSFIARHEMDSNIVLPFLSFYENLEISWQHFQELCESDFEIPKHLE